MISCREVRAVGSDHGLLVARWMDLAVDGQHGDGNFEHDGVHVEARDRIGSIVVSVVCILGSEAAHRPRPYGS